MENQTKSNIEGSQENSGFHLNNPFVALQEKVESIKKEIGKVIVGQEKTIDLIMVALLSEGHLLLEGVPGVAKTLTANLLAKTIDTQFNRIQFTPDLMPSDVTGTSVYNAKLNEFEFRKGPIFSNIVLIDEINRSPAKTQAALFEVMQERQVTFDGQTREMSYPFVIIATQNPIEHEGTYQLPEAQLDRFMFKIYIDYPNLDDEIEILRRKNTQRLENQIKEVEKKITPDELRKFQNEIHQVTVNPSLLNYIAQIVGATRGHHSLYLGASPRASVALLHGAKALSAIKGRNFVTPEDIKYLTSSVLDHRIIIAPEREMEGVTKKDIVNEIINSIEIPR